MNETPKATFRHVRGLIVLRVDGDNPTSAILKREQAAKLKSELDGAIAEIDGDLDACVIARQTDDCWRCGHHAIDRRLDGRITCTACGHVYRIG